MRSLREIFRSYAVFNAEGKHVNGSDKQSNHAYGDAYDSLFVPYTYDDNLCTPVYEGGRMVTRSCKECASDTSHFVTCSKFKRPNTLTRENCKLMMEIGVADGSSLCAWREAFPNALVVGMDIHHSDRANGERIEFYLGDQRSKEDCERAAAGRQFDLIVEDATHQLTDTLVTLLYLWPFVKPGGMYIVEEFCNIGALKEHVKALWPCAEIVDTPSPFGGLEQLVVLRK